MSNIYLKVTIEKDWRSQNFDFLSLKICSQVSFWGAPTHPDIESKSPSFLLKANINFNKNETESKWKIPRTVLARRTLWFSSYKKR